MSPTHFLVIDLEATCDDAGDVPRYLMETIEIGAVLCDAETLQPVAEFQTFIRPVRTRNLTPFCTQLTSITDEMVADAPTFPAAITALGAFIDDRAALFCSWGDYDRKQFEQDARFHRVALPFRHGHRNLKRSFSDALGTRRRFGMAGALRRVQLPLRGTHHRGIDDARNIARLLPWCLGRVAAPEAPERRKRRSSDAALARELRRMRR